MVAIGVNSDGYREVIGAAEGFTESKVEKKQWEVNVYSKYTFGDYRDDNTNAR